MPRYYFDLVDGSILPDEEGQHFGDLSAACESAERSAREIMSNAIWQGRLPLHECFRIKDDRGQVLRVVKFRDLVAIDREPHAVE
jgi:hypothetical protein